MRLIKLTEVFINHHTGDYETVTPLYLNPDTVAAIRSNEDGTTFIGTIGCGCYSVEEGVETILELMGRTDLNTDPPAPYLKGLDKPEKKPTKITLGLDPKAFSRAVYNLTHKGAGEGPEEPDPDSYEE